MNMTERSESGFGLVEILITVGIIAVGVLGVATLHSTITGQSAENKARSEALAIAQSRIEEMRNYTGAVASYDDFDTLFSNTYGFANDATISGVNAAFARTERIVTQDDKKQVDVRVLWRSRNDEPRSVQLGTEIGFALPRSVADVAREGAPPLVNAPTGRARLGEGVLPSGAQTTPNDDGTALYQDGGEDLMLVFDDQIVLTLAAACQTDVGECIDFVRIRGRVYIDTASHGNLNPGHVSLVASDAAFCARHYTVDGAVFSVTTNSNNVPTTPNGDYRYFDYTCYIGGGWHGNVGILLAGGIRQQDKICLGDPVSAEPWEAPIIASRRAYRGMLYRHDGSTGSGKQETPDGQGGTMIRYYSHGIADSTELPVPGMDQAGHDFVIASMQPSATAGSNCVTQGVMVRADSNVDGMAGDLFEGMPRDFYCLNGGFLDSYDESKFGHTAHCPYDPTNPPSTRHLVSGSIAVQAPQSSANDLLVASVNALTSDGPGNCLVSNFAHNGSSYQANYSCDVYDWGNGWTGFVRVTYDASGMSCTPNQLSFSGVNGNTSGHNFTQCSPGSFAVISGTVTTSNPNNRYLTSATLSDGGECSVSDGGLAYTCITAAIDEGQAWSGSISFGISGGALCGAAGGVVSLANIEPGYETRNLQIANNQSQCP